MYRRIFSTILAVLVAAAGLRAEALSPTDGCYARLEGDTLRLGNGLIERVFVWNGGNLMTARLTDKQAGRSLRTTVLRPDFSLGPADGGGSGATFEVEDIRQTPIHAAFLKATVEYALGTMRIRREFRIYPDVPAIACSNFLRGELESPQAGILDRVSFPGRHWHLRVVRFQDVTDINNNLVSEEPIISYRRKRQAGNLLFARDGVDGYGFYFLKEAPCSDMQLAWPGHDFASEFGQVAMEGLGLVPSDIAKEEWVQGYGSVIGVFGDGELSALVSLRDYQKTVRRYMDGRDGMIMMNTWGDRNRDARLNEAFCMEELDKGARLGITHFQIDDGWQTGKSPASALKKGSFEDIWKDPDYWTPDPEKYPRGLAPVVEHGRKLGIEPGLWFNPSCQDELAEWEKDADAIVKLFKEYDIRYFKIDGLQVPTKKAEKNLRNLFDKVQRETGNAVVINLDVTAGRRPGYFYMGGYGNIFLENRYTDFGSYYPYLTLRNLWQLSRYVPAERLQVEFLNKWRNPDKYPECDPFAPACYDFSYLFAIAMAGQPLAWMEASNLPEEAFGIAPLVEDYKAIMSEWHQGTILPIGKEPDGRSWTGFQSLPRQAGRAGFLLVFREDSPEATADVTTWLPAGKRVHCTPVLGDGKKFSAKVGPDGSLPFHLPSCNSFALYRYETL